MLDIKKSISCEDGNFINQSHDSNERIKLGSILSIEMLSLMKSFYRRAVTDRPYPNFLHTSKLKYIKENE